MHDGAFERILRRNQSVIPEMDRYIEGLPGAGQLPQSILKGYRNRVFTIGWRVPVVFSDGIHRELHILADGNFPYTPPKIAVANRPPVLTWPHLESEGVLCILPSDAAVSSQEPAALTAFVLGEACQLIEDNIKGENVEDFGVEFLSYWELASDDNARPIISILEPKETGRKISIWHGKHRRVAGENPKALKQWLSWRAANSGKGGQYKFKDGVLLWLPNPLLPADYPRTAADVRSLALKNSPEAAQVLEELSVRGMEEIDTLIGFQTVRGICFGAVSIGSPRETTPHKRTVKSLEKGFRPGHTPRKLLVSRYLSRSNEVAKSTVHRADHHWVHGRDQDQQQARLRAARVAILGCGSLGSTVARLMAKAGVGSLLLIDSDIIDWPNLSRHELGATSIRRQKASALAERIRQEYPHLKDVSSFCKHVGPKTWKSLEDIASSDLIVSTMGNWSAENFLNDVQQESPEFPPVIYGWVEPNAVAAHSLVIYGRDACLRCGLNDKGRPDLAVTEWPDDGGICHAPACNAVFTPYGPTELCWAHALLSDTAIAVITGEIECSCHRVWIGYRRRVEAAGGVWAPGWISNVGDPDDGGTTMEREWPSKESCPVCARHRPAA